MKVSPRSGSPITGSDISDIASWTTGLSAGKPIPDWKIWFENFQRPPRNFRTSTCRRWLIKLDGSLTWRGTGAVRDWARSPGWDAGGRRPAPATARGGGAPWPRRRPPSPWTCASVPAAAALWLPPPPRDSSAPGAPPNRGTPAWKKKKNTFLKLILFN